jgi:hypothetical protein
MLGGFVTLRSVARQHIMSAAHGRAKWLTSWPRKKEEKEEETMAP